MLRSSGFELKTARREREKYFMPLPASLALHYGAAKHPACLVDANPFAFSQGYFSVSTGA